MIEITKPYTFTSLDPATGDKVQSSLLDMFTSDRIRQVIVYHFMFGPDMKDPCEGCSSGAATNALVAKQLLDNNGIRIVYVSRAPIERIANLKKSRGWTIDWYSSYDSDFNYDFHVTLDPDAGSNEYNFRTVDELRAKNLGYMASGEQQGISCFVRGGVLTGIGEEGKVYYTYSTHSRGVELADAVFGWQDLTKLGRVEPTR